MPRQVPSGDLVESRSAPPGSEGGGAGRPTGVAVARLDRPSDRFVTLNFKVPVGVRKRFRLLAANADLKNVELLVHLLDHYERNDAAVS